MHRRLRRATGTAAVLAAAAAPPAVAAGSDWAGWLRSLQGEVRVTADTVAWRGLEFADVDVPIALGDDAVRVDGGRAGVAGGEVRFDARYDAAGHLRLEARGRGLEPGHHAALAGRLEGVPLAVDVDLSGRGPTPGVALAGATGRVRAHNTGGGRLPRASDTSGIGPLGGPVSGLFSMFTLFAGEAAARQVECLALDWPFRDGRADAAHAVELRTPRVRVTGGGTIDLAAETLSITLVPAARHGVDPARLALGGAITLVGPFDAPVLSVDKSGLLDRAATLGGDAVATLSGARLLGLVGDQTEAPPSLCNPAPR